MFSFECDTQVDNTAILPPMGLYLENIKLIKKQKKKTKKKQKKKISFNKISQITNLSFPFLFHSKTQSMSDNPGMFNYHYL
jgi:hypothetical protein